MVQDPGGPASGPINRFEKFHGRGQLKRTPVQLGNQLAVNRHEGQGCQRSGFDVPANQQQQVVVADEVVTLLDRVIVGTLLELT